MTYKNIRKIQVYILIFISYFIFTDNIQLIFKTRSILETDKKKLPGVIFLPKSLKNETKANKGPLLTTLAPSSESLEALEDQYIKDKHKRSLSRLSEWNDKLPFWQKRLIDGVIRLFQDFYLSVKYRYLLGQKSLELKRQIYLKRLEGLVGTRGLSLVKGMLFGDLSSIDQETYHSFKVIGILHILSASSANFTIFLQFCLFFLRPISSYLSKRQHFCLRFSIIFVYFSLVGAAASTLRAFLTLNLAFLAIFVLKRSFLPIFNLCLAAIFMLIINPMILNTMSFQFSFLASFGILFLYNFFEKEPSINKSYLLKSILLTASAQFFLMPISIANFAELNYLAILANLFVLPLVELLTLLFLASFIMLFISDIFSVSLFEHFLSFSITKLIDILFLMINTLEKIPYKSLTFNEDKDQYVAVFVLIDLCTIIYVSHLKNKRYSKNKYRIFK